VAELSPAAQAIVDAAVQAGGKYGRATPTLHTRLAAALRAVAEQCVPDDSEGHWVYIPHVIAIAAELEISATENQ
jgi:hypothetical protein